MAKKAKISKVKVYKLLNECVERGVAAGWMKSHKHTDTPSEDLIKEMIENYIMNEIDEYFDFD